MRCGAPAGRGRASRAEGTVSHGTVWLDVSGEPCVGREAGEAGHGDEITDTGHTLGLVLKATGVTAGPEAGLHSTRNLCAVVGGGRRGGGRRG